MFSGVMVYVSRLCNGFVFIGSVMVCVSQWCNGFVPRWCNGFCSSVV